MQKLRRAANKKGTMPVDFIPVLLLAIIVVSGAFLGFSRGTQKAKRRAIRLAAKVCLAGALAVLIFLYIGAGFVQMTRAWNGNVEAQFEVAKWYQSGFNTGLFSWRKKAAASFQKAAEMGHAASQYQMGVLCSRGLGVPQDLPQAVYWFEKAATNGIPEAAERAEWFRREGSSSPSPTKRL
jgi:TPR repeat protein